MEYPIRVLGYGYVPDSGGAGQYRGGLALFREFQYIGKTPCQLQIRSDRSVTPPYGLNKGESGSLSKNILNPGTTIEKILPNGSKNVKKIMFKTTMGKAIRVEQVKK